MSGSLSNPTTWRLKTPGGVPYRVVSFNGGFTDERGSAEVKVLISASSLEDFVSELLPPPVTVGYISVPQSVSLPGLPTMVVRNVTFKSFDDGLPIDPFQFDIAGTASYYGVLELTVSYDTQSNKKESNENDPLTFLEISAQHGGDYLHTPSSKAKWLELEPGVEINSNKTQPPMDDAKSAKLAGGGTVVDDSFLAEGVGTKKSDKDPNLYVTVTVPTTKWTVRWPQMPREVYDDVMIHRLRMMLGRVNDSTFTLLNNAPKETVLFLGHNYSEHYTWRRGLIGKPPVSLEMSFLEKRVVWKGLIHGHNSFWRKDEGKGWARLYVDEHNNTTYSTWDFNQLFQI